MAIKRKPVVAEPIVELDEEVPEAPLAEKLPEEVSEAPPAPEPPKEAPRTPPAPEPSDEPLAARAMRVLAKNTSGVPASSIALQVEISLSSANGLLNGLLESGSVRCLFGNTYQVTPKGLEQLAAFDRGRSGG